MKNDTDLKNDKKTGDLSIINTILFYSLLKGIIFYFQNKKNIQILNRH